jgi:hypothetical protein
MKIRSLGYVKQFVVMNLNCIIKLENVHSTAKDTKGLGQNKAIELEYLDTVLLMQKSRNCSVQNHWDRSEELPASVPVILHTTISALLHQENCILRYSSSIALC